MYRIGSIFWRFCNAWNSFIHRQGTANLCTASPPDVNTYSQSDAKAIAVYNTTSHSLTLGYKQHKNNYVVYPSILKKKILLVVFLQNITIFMRCAICNAKNRPPHKIHHVVCLFGAWRHPLNTFLIPHWQILFAVSYFVCTFHISCQCRYSVRYWNTCSIFSKITFIVNSRLYLFWQWCDAAAVMTQLIMTVFWPVHMRKQSWTLIKIWFEFIRQFKAELSSKQIHWWTVLVQRKLWLN